MNPDAPQTQEDQCRELSDKSTRKRIKYTDEQRTEDGGFIIKTFYPTSEQMKDFSSYMKYIHQEGGHRAGLAKIVPPSGYRPRKIGYDDESLYEMEITCPIRQEVTGEGGLYQQMNIVDKKKMTVRNFKRLSEEKHPTPLYREGSTLDRDFWKNVFTNPSIYGADVPGTLFDPDFDEFNLTKLNTILDDIQGDYGVTIQGVNTTYLYFGMWKSSFCWHTEDMDLYSINYLHTGAPKSWYCIAPEYGRRFERLAESFFPHSFKSCKAFLRHKTTLISPQVLKKYSIPFSRGIQMPGEFMVTFPYSYHSGFNNGFNIAEATNFATEHWIDYGKWATRCDCSAESVKISMQTFVKRYQSDRYENWIRGRDVCKDPRNPNHIAAAPRPTEHDLYVMGIHDRYDDDSYVEAEQEDDKRRVALQQNLSSNVKRKTKSLKKTFKSIEETYQRYSEFLLTRETQYKVKSEQQLALPHYSPIVTSMAPISESVPIRSCDNLKLDLKNRPDYDLLAKNNKKNKAKTKKDEKISQKKEQRARERIIASQELLQFLPTTFTHEKKFNRCIAALPPHCAVCQILMPHPKDDENIWGMKTTTTGVAQPTPEQQTDSTSQSTTTVSDNEVPMLVDKKPTSAGTQVEEFRLPERSKVLLPRAAIGNHAWVVDDTVPSQRDSEPVVGEENKQEAEEAPQGVVLPKEADSGYEDRCKFLDIDVEEPYELLQCTVCMLCVHSICYGVIEIPDNKEDWVCDRCKESNRSTVNCVICPCRGGALKQVDSDWMHISCALTLPNVKLEDILSTENERKKNFKLPDTCHKSSCIYCIKNTGISKYIQGKLLSCPGDGVNSCSATFHPICGHRNGSQFEILDHHHDPKMTHTMIARCAECTNRIRLMCEAPGGHESMSQSEQIRVGTRVVALSSKRGSYYDGIVQTNFRRTSYELFFPQANEIDASVGEKNIRNLDKNKEFKMGDKVVVRTKSGEVTGKFKRKQYDDSEYLVQFSGSVQKEKVLRKNIYLNIDQMSEHQVEEYLNNCDKKVEDDEIMI